MWWRAWKRSSSALRPAAMMLRFVHRHLPVLPWPGTTVHQASLIWSLAVLCFVCLLASCFQLVLSHLVLNVCLDCSIVDTCPADLSVIIVMPVLEQCPWRWHARTSIPVGFLSECKLCEVHPMCNHLCRKFKALSRMSKLVCGSNNTCRALQLCCRCKQRCLQQACRNCRHD